MYFSVSNKRSFPNKLEHQQFSFSDAIRIARALVFCFILLILFQPKNAPGFNIWFTSRKNPND